ncbi:MAG: DNA oxidative demethylase AlkB [Ectothiorhodospiraceae bacterium]|nr:DNA oxidative demethylase AlkB [Ectothiorhodospiraceae bacterium]
MPTDKDRQPVNLDLFVGRDPLEPERQVLGPGAVLLREYAAERDGTLLAALDQVLQAVPLRRMSTPGGRPMSVATASCGTLGWVTDRRGYRYQGSDPASGRPWPPMPEAFAQLAADAAAEAGYPSFRPDSCLINRYAPGARMGLHQDRDERDMSHPIVSVSLGVPAVFLFGGLRRNERPQRVRLLHGDVVIWGGASRLRFHGVAPLKAACHPRLGRYRINLTLRRAG